jgi:hypothetical protein
MPIELREVKLIRMKRKHIHLTRQDRYGHWWLEIGDPANPTSESYGWWPRDRVNVKQTLLGMDGELNGQTTFGGEPTRDPHHGESADEEFHPCVDGADDRSDEEIAECLRGFARAFHGEWRWTFGKGQTCHSFQEQAIAHCRLTKAPNTKKS